MASAFKNELEVAATLAQQAGKVILAVYASDFTVSSKGEAGPVTDADLRSSEIIVEGLRREFPRDRVVSEEGAPAGPEGGGRVWYVDPLDGTKEFVSRNGEFSVIIGLAVDGQARAGIVYQPVGERLYMGEADEEAWLEANGSTTPLAVSKEARLPELRLVVSRSHHRPWTDRMRDHIGLTKQIRCGSVGLKIGLLSTRDADVYLDTSGFTSAWDVCGAEAVLRGAGGRLTDLYGQPIRYGNDTLRNENGLLATNAVCHDRIVAAIAPVVATMRDAER